MAINGVAVGITVTGAVFLYSGLTNKSVLSVIQNVITGKTPETAKASAEASTQTAEASAAPLTSTSGTTSASYITSSDVSGGGSGQTALQQAATAKGWGSGAEWTALEAIENQEAGFNPTATNPTSGAYGMAQSLGHSFAGGPAPNGVNEYGGYGLTASQSEQASMGDPTYQAIWMVNYIASRYGDPIAGEQFHLANNYY